MPVPADPKWRERRWQTYYQSRADYIRELYSSISFYKKMLRHWEALGRKWPRLASDLIPHIKSDRNQLEMAQNELRKVVRR